MSFTLDIVNVGVGALYIAPVFALFAMIAAILSDRMRRPVWLRSARNATHVVTGLLLIASAALLYALLTKDYSVFYVFQNTRDSQSLLYTWTAFWGGNAGSLLFWAAGLGIFASVAITTNWRSQHRLMPGVIAVLMAVALFFLLLMVFVSHPFERLDFTPPNGRGLNPLLQDPGMAFHPPMLLLGYMSMSIPFAFAMAALLSGRLDASWLRATRRWALAAWGILSLGLIFGAWWAYRVLGWGGYWGWDPVENVALIPWLAVSAYVHSAIVTEKRGVLKVWTMALVILSFTLAIFGTFIVRSGVITSVHSFAQSSIGPWFFSFLGVILIVGFAALVYRLPQLSSRHSLDSIVSRESGFLFNNLLLMSMVFVTTLGVLFPLISELISGVQITVGPPFYNQVNGPLLLALMLLMGIGPLLPWRHATPGQLWERFRWSLALFGTVWVTLLVVLRSIWPALAFATVAFTAMTIVQEYARGISARRSVTGESLGLAALRLVGRARGRYGGYLVHAGLVFIAFGVVGSQFFHLERGVTLAQGESETIGRYQLTYMAMDEGRSSIQQTVTARLAVARDGKMLTVMEPGKRYLAGFEEQPTSNIAIRSTPLEDLYIVLTGWDETGASFFIFVNPLVMWIWLGGLVLMAGGLIAWWPQRQPRTQPVRRSATQPAEWEAVSHV
ncbi:MAG: heme lyase CcmF/NrfE family subunit [Caldilineaceae bacterium]|nr:heme lyase CcmF/NrfE family subunit [Caldilineaceae bacterium]